jgi:hypothetical protein
MRRKFISIAILPVVGALLLILSNCARDQELVGIQIQPGSETFGAANIPIIDNKGAQVQLRALGSYIHPPVTKDITNQATWASNTPQMFTVDSTGMLTATGEACGSTLVSATVTTNSSAGGISSSGSLVTGYMTASVVCPTGSGGGGDALTVTFGQSTGSGTVVSTPGGASCVSPGPCVGAFTPGSTVTLQANANPGSSFVSWVGCDTAGNVNPCSVTMTGNRIVTVTFQ